MQPRTISRTIDAFSRTIYRQNPIQFKFFPRTLSEALSRQFYSKDGYVYWTMNNIVLQKEKNKTTILSW